MSQMMVLTTNEIKDLLDKGYDIYLPEVQTIDEPILENYSNGDIRVNQPLADRKITSIDFVGVEEAQCIALDDEDHLYITDDGIVTHNTSNIVFLKSTDNQMMQTLEKMSGSTHVSYSDSKTVTKDLRDLSLFANEGKVSYTYQTVEKPVITYNDMAFIAQRNSIVFRAGDSPIWNRNQTALPMSWRLFLNQISQPGKNYNLSTLPTLSTVSEFDLGSNQPNFDKMLAKRMEQALDSPRAKEIYQKAYGYDDYQISKLNRDVYSDDVMDIVDAIALAQKEAENNDDGSENSHIPMDIEEMISSAEDNDAVLESMAENMERYTQKDAKIYAGEMLSRNMIISDYDGIDHTLDTKIVHAYLDSFGAFTNDDRNFRVDDTTRELWGADGEKYISKLSHSDLARELDEAAQRDDNRIYSEGDDDYGANFSHSYKPEDAFYRFLVSQDNWLDFAGGRFESAMHRALRID